MKKLLVIVVQILFVIFATNAKADCISRHVNRINAVAPKSTIKAEVAQAICRYLSPVWRDYFIVIATIESGVQQINSEFNKDFGIVQIHEREVRARNLYVELLQTDIPYQVMVFREILSDKRRSCQRDLPDTWMSCWHSKTPKHHNRYSKLFKEYYNKIRRVK